MPENEKKIHKHKEKGDDFTESQKRHYFSVKNK